MTIIDDQIAENGILNKIKDQYNPGPMRPMIVRICSEHQKPISELKLQWMFYAGMGNCDLHDHWKKRERKATENLLKKGHLVPMAKEEYYHLTIQRIKHFDDVSWGRLEDGRIVIYDLALADNLKDTLVIPEGLQVNAVKALERRIEFGLSIGKVMEDTPITLNNGTVVTPILTDFNTIQLRQRQRKERHLTP